MPIKSRKKEELLRAYKEMYEFCEQRGFKPRLHKLDNETSQEVEKFIRQQCATFQYTPPDMHRTNPAERAIQTYKACAKSILANLPSTFPLGYWCRLIPHIDISVNIMRPCRQNPLLSAWAALEGEFHFDATPLAPPGTEMLLHERASRRASWGFNAKKAWYIGPCLHHYRNVQAIMKETGATRITDTYRLQHHTIAIPQLTDTDRIIAATKELEDAISRLPPKPIDEIEAIKKLREIVLQEKQKAKLRNHVRTPTKVRAQRTQASGDPTQQPTASSSPVNRSIRPLQPNYISDDEHEEGLTTKTLPNVPTPRRSKRVQNQVRPAYSTNTVSMEPPIYKYNVGKYTRPYKMANQFLQLREWARKRQCHIEREKGGVAGAIIDDETGNAMEYRALIKNPKYREVWQRSYANELGRLAQGVRDIKGTDTIRFIHKSDIPYDRWKDVTYGRIVVDFRPQKSEPHRTRLTVGGNKINYPFETSTPTADLATIKVLWNSTISTPGAKFVTMDVKNFYLMTPMERPEYMRLQLSLMPPEIIDKYNLNDIADNEWVYVKIVRGMYGLPQAGYLAHKLLAKRLNTHGYYACQFTPGLWRHVWRPIIFALVVDDFSIKFQGDAYAN